MSGLFISFEGGEGGGKSTQIKLLNAHYSIQRRHVVSTREPGGTIAAEEVRSLLVNGEPGKWSSTAEALLNYAARDAHLRDVIRPALAAGKIVLSDRFMDSTRAYQCVAGDCPEDLISTLETTVVGETRPDLTFIFDLDPVLGLERAKLRGSGLEDRYERKGLAFHQALRKGFLDIAESDPKRCVVLNAALSVDAVWDSLLMALKDRGHG
jgi:dTMP kinase